MPAPLLELRDKNCTLCRLHTTAEVVCQMGTGPVDADIMVVSKMPNSREWQLELEEQLEEMGLGTDRIYFTQAIKCRTFEQDASNPNVKTCASTYLREEIARIKPKFILALGNEALLSVAGRSGITKYRGRVFEDPGGYDIIATISPSAVKRSPGQRPGYMADLRLFVNRVLGVAGGIAKPNYAVIDTDAKLKTLKKLLGYTKEFDFDVETYSDYYKSDGRIISLSATCIIEAQDEATGEVKRRRFVFALPLYHPESPWKTRWKSVLKFLKPELERIPKVTAWNASYDIKWMRQETIAGIDMFATCDPMLAVHLLNENVQKGLKPQSMARLGVEPWGVDTKNLLSMPLSEVLEYNVLDTWYMHFVKKQVLEELKKQPRLARIFKFVMMPAHAELVRAEMRGIFIDVERLKERTPIAEAKLKEIEDDIASHLPTPDSDEWPRFPDKQLKTTIRKGKPREINFNASIFARWFLFDYLQLPVLERGKEKPDGRPGDPSMAEGILLELKEILTDANNDDPFAAPEENRDQLEVIEGFLSRIEWNKMLSSFFYPYAELYDENHRIHTNFKLAGTVTGRLSSGKNDPDKISGSKGKVRGVNLQQVPRDKFVRGLFGAPPGWLFVESDYSQVELRLAAFIAREMTMIRLFQEGADLHSYIVHRVTGIPLSEVPKKLRKELGKPLNFGFIYGMGWSKFIETAFKNYGVRFTEEQAKGYRDMYFNAYPGLLPWHGRQRRLVNEYGRVQSPLGRVRHLPDVYSPDQGVRAEAERQAINSPVQSMGSDMAVLSMVEINRRFRAEGIQGHCIGLVHDAVNYEIREDSVGHALPIIKNVMEDVSLIRRKFGTVIDVPIVADIKVGTRWGDAMELTPEQVYDWDPSILSAA